LESWPSHARCAIPCGELPGDAPAATMGCMSDTAQVIDRFNAVFHEHRFGDGGSVRGVNLMHVRDGGILEALGYAKVP